MPPRNTTHDPTHKDSPSNASGHADGEKPSRPATETLIPLVPSVRRLGEFFHSRRQATPEKSRSLASDSEGVYVFYPPQVEQALDRNMDAIARLVEATRRPQLDADLRDILLLATADVRIANQQLCVLLDSCGLCGHHPVARVCANCGARKGAPS